MHLLPDLATFFNQSFWQNLVVSLFGTLIGTFGALYVGYRLYRSQEIKQYRRSGSAKAERRQQLLLILKGTVTKNRKLLLQMQQELKTLAITYNVDLLTLDFVITEASDGLNNWVLFNEMAELRYELAHLQTKLNAQLSLGLDPNLAHVAIKIPGGIESVAYPYLWERMVESIQQHIPSIIKRCDEIDATITKDLTELKAL